VKRAWDVVADTVLGLLLWFGAWIMGDLEVA
jgi:hypothetical protein